MKLSRGAETIIQYSAEENNWSADLALWRESVPPPESRPDIHLIRDYLPPHIVRTRPNGDILGIRLENGELIPPANDSSQAAESFINQAAIILDTGAKLDLIGQYLLFYVYDSPDPTRPFLIGQDNLSGDIHQTTYQTLGTVAGGQFRGDCDDLSEVAHLILERQGHIPHVISSWACRLCLG